MKSAKQVEKKIEKMKASGIPLAEAAWKAALYCVGWPYIFGDRGQYCTPAHRKAAYASKGAEHPTIKSKCKNFNGTGTCSGCTFYPGGQTRAFDCRGFTYWILLQIYGWKLMGAGATSQWNNADNWKAKGEIKTMPKNTLCCLFVQKGKTMQHTGFGLNNETVECSSGVQHFTSRNKKWTHWAVPAPVEGEITPSGDDEDEDPSEDRPILKRGSKGEYVRQLQKLLQDRGYDLGKCGIDGDFGRATEAAVKEFQKDSHITADGIVGPNTWAAFDGKSESNLYTVHIPLMPLPKAQSIVAQYPGSYLTAEGSEQE
jgi:hypothetical protein